VVLQAEKSSDSLEVYAEKKALEQKGRTYISDQKTTINGLASYHQLVEIDQDQKENLRARISYIKYGSNILTFTALSTKNNFNRYNSQFSNVIGSFKRLSDRAHLNRRAKRLKIVKANGRQTLQNIFRGAGMPKDVWPRFAILNAMKLNDVPQRNSLIKVVQ
jgi:predicted Zn-dependent protease